MKAGNVGLEKGIEQFIKKHLEIAEYNLATDATWWIRAEITKTPWFARRFPR